MTSTSLILKSRRRREQSGRSMNYVLGALLVIAVLLVFASGALLLNLRASFMELSAGFPPIDHIEDVFGGVGREGFRPVRVYDRSGSRLLFEALPPEALGKQWHYIDANASMTLPPHTVQAAIASQDESFWVNPGYQVDGLLAAVVNTSDGAGAEVSDLTITQALVEAQLVPLGRLTESRNGSFLQSALLASELTKEYPKEKILEWYINSADFGSGAYGIDAASLIYFGKHASDLDLSESAFLAAMLQNGEMAQEQIQQDANMLKAGMLAKMVELGDISKQEAETARIEKLVFAESFMDGQGRSELEEFILQELSALLGANALRRSGLRVTSSIDYDLQSQSECLLASHLKRFSGESPEATVSTREGATCLMAGLLPPMRPGDIGLDHHLTEGSLLVLDSDSGEILSAVGEVGSPKKAGDIFFPYIYLTAFAQGYSPGTMVMDLPDLENRAAPAEESLDGYFGPVRMRTALVNLLEGAAIETIHLVGLENVLHTAQSMGIGFHVVEGDVIADAETEVEIEASLRDIVFSMGVIGNRGVMMGGETAAGSELNDETILQPVIIKEVEDASQRLIYQYEPQNSVILSPQLAYLMADTLSDENERKLTLGPSNPLEVGRPSGAVTGIADNGRGYWTLGFTPSRAVGVWLGGSEESAPVSVTSLNGAAPVWHALIQFAVKDIPIQGWEIPPGVSQMEVCDPSGMLPTEFCPSVVREVFISGTEPTHTDTLYKPFLVNRETGKLATLYTPPDLIEERVYLVPPAQALEWASLIGLEQPPEEYDTIFDESAADPGVNISSPAPFETIHGKLKIRGIADIDDISFYRLQYGQGLNPRQWIQIEDDGEESQRGTLGEWDTTDLSGLYTLQLIVVDDDGQLKSSAIHVTIDNRAPEITIVYPDEDEITGYSVGDEVVVQVNVEDEFGVEEVMFEVDGMMRARLNNPPFSLRWTFESTGEHEISIRAQDLAGNTSEIETLVFAIR